MAEGSALIVPLVAVNVVLDGSIDLHRFERGEGPVDERDQQHFAAPDAVGIGQRAVEPRCRCM